MKDRVGLQIGGLPASAGSLIVSLVALLLVGCQATKTPLTAVTQAPDTRPVKEERETVGADDPERWALISKTLNQPGTFAGEVYTITIPRDDLWVTTDIGDIPTAAGLETNLHFFKCPCGRTSVVGKFVVADYEANDVIDELQTDAILKIASMGPMLLREKPRVLVIHFQGEGDADKLATILKGALSHTGDQRLPSMKLPVEP